MMILLLLISIALFILLLCADSFDEFACIPLMGFIIKMGVIVFLCVKLVNIKVIDETIELYTKQNQEIETKIELVIKQYMEHEHQTFKDLTNNDSYITLVTLYPELKSDELIKEEIRLYEENNKKIISLKENKINEKIYKWWIYFGK